MNFSIFDWGQQGPGSVLTKVYESVPKNMNHMHAALSYVVIKTTTKSANGTLLDSIVGSQSAQQPSHTTSITLHQHA